MTAQWIDVLAAEALEEGAAIEVEAHGRDVALYRVNGEIFATDSICTHGQARLCDGFLEGYEIECPLHQGKFDVRSGKALTPPVVEDIASYPVRVEQGRVYLRID